VLGCIRWYSVVLGGVWGIKNSFDSGFGSIRIKLSQLRRYENIYQEKIYNMRRNVRCKMCIYIEENWQRFLHVGDKIDVQDLFKNWYEAEVICVDINTC
jgi:hypothetical protein